MPQWAPLFWELSEHSADELLQSDDEWQQVLAVLRAQGAEGPEFQRVFTEAVRRLEALGNHEPVRWAELMKVC